MKNIILQEAIFTLCSQILLKTTYLYKLNWTSPTASYNVRVRIFAFASLYIRVTVELVTMRKYTEPRQLPVMVQTNTIVIFDTRDDFGTRAIVHHLDIKLENFKIIYK